MLIERSAETDRLLAEGKQAIEGRRLGAALHALRGAAEAGRALNAERSRVFAALLENADTLVAIDWRVAESLLNLAEGLDAQLHAPADLWKPIQREKCEADVKTLLAEVARLQSADNLPRVRGRLIEALHRYPKERRLQEGLESIDATLAAQQLQEEREGCLARITALKNELEHAGDPTRVNELRGPCDGIVAAHLSDARVAAIWSDVSEQAAPLDAALAAPA